MPTEVENMLKGILCLRDDSTNILRTRESTQVEFKQSFGFGSMPEYVRTMVAFANTEGGFIVFGVRNSPHELLGLNASRFDSIDPAKVSSFLNAHCSPEIQWEIGTVDYAGVRLGFIYTFRHLRKPVLITATSGKELKEGDIYYRYRGQTTTIRYSELRTIIDNLLDQERRAWLQHLSTISEAGAANVAILDTLQGKLFGAGTPFLIDEALLRQIKFIREGQFTEAAGAPTLMLVGEVKTVSGVSTTRIVQRGIHFEDLVTAFLTSRPLSAEDAKSYLLESCHQLSAFAPIFYFVKQAKIPHNEAASFVRDAKSGLLNTRRSIVERLSKATSVMPVGTIERDGGTRVRQASSVIATEMASAKGLQAKRTMLWSVLSTSPEEILASLPSVPIQALLEAITHMERPACIKYADILKQMLLTLFGTEFQKMDRNGKSLFRKAVAFLDQELYGYEGATRAFSKRGR
jgi:hypothetical protein